MAEYLSFDPFPYFNNPHLQTIVAAILIFNPEPPSKQMLVPLPDGDKISLEVTTPQNWKATDDTVILIHGLCGSHRSPNSVRTAKRLAEQGVRVARFNMRGCGSGKGHAKKIYHAGLSGDLLEVVHALKKEHPASPISVAGFSMGAQLTLKLAGELGELGPSLLKQVIAVSPPSQMDATKSRLCSTENLFYQGIFLSILKEHVEFLQTHKDQTFEFSWPENMTLSQFDDKVTAPWGGFKDAADYHACCSALPLVPNIKIPCKILFAEDDPIIPSDMFDGMALPENIRVFKTEKGGHLGFLAHPRQGKGIFWLDTVVIDWLLN